RWSAGTGLHRGSLRTRVHALAVRHAAGAMGIPQQTMRASACHPIAERSSAGSAPPQGRDYEVAGRRITARADRVYGAETAAPVAPGAPDPCGAAVPRGFPARLPVSLARH